jgi:hypothetical protein
MRNSDSPWRRFKALFAVLMVSAALAAVPEPLRSQWQSSFQHALAWPRTLLPSSTAAVDTSEISSDLTRRNEELEFALSEMSRRTETGDGSLLAPYVVRAHVLGRLARRYLDPPALLGIGTDDRIIGERIVDESLVLDIPPTLVDRGTRNSADVDQLVLAGRHVWGKVVNVGPTTALVRHVSEQGYRDVVQLAHRDELSGEHAEFHCGARGLLEGCGQSLCRIRYVETTVAVSVGDWVVASGLDGLVDAPLIYGRIVRAEHAPAESHWELWMDPAARGNVTVVEILGGRTHDAQLVQHESSTRR